MMNRLLSAIPSSSRSASMIRPIVSTGRTQYVRSAIQSSRFYSTRPTPSGLDEGEKAIYEKLAAKFPGDRLEVQDVSGKPFCLYLGKADRSGGCGSFYAIEISSPAFKGLSTIKQHKLVNTCLKEDIKTIHGLQVSPLQMRIWLMLTNSSKRYLKNRSCITCMLMITTVLKTRMARRRALIKEKGSFNHIESIDTSGGLGDFGCRCPGSISVSSGALLLLFLVLGRRNMRTREDLVSGLGDSTHQRLIIYWT